MFHPCSASDQLGDLGGNHLTLFNQLQNGNDTSTSPHGAVLGTRVWKVEDRWFAR